MTQPIDTAQFMQWLTILSESCRQQISQPTIASYYTYFNGKLSTEQFCNSAQQLFEQGCDRLPPPVEWVKLARSLTPDLALPPAPEPTAFVDLSPSEQAAYREALQQARSTVMANLSRTKGSMTHIFDTLEAIADSRPPAQTLQQHLEAKRRWLVDPVLKGEAIQWAIAHPDVELLTDDEGAIADLQLVGG